MKLAADERLFGALSGHSSAAPPQPLIRQIPDQLVVERQAEPFARIALHQPERAADGPDRP